MPTHHTTHQPRLPRPNRRLFFSAAKLATTVFTAAALVSSADTASGTIYTWRSSNNFNWETSANWVPADSFPKESADTAYFDIDSLLLLNGRTITISAPVTLNALQVQGNDSQGSNLQFTINSGDSTLFLTGNQNTPTISLTSRAQLTLVAPVIVQNSTSLLIQNDSALGGAIILNKEISFAANDSSNSINAAAAVGGTITLAGGIADSVGFLKKEGSGTLRITGTTSTAYNYTNFHFNGGSLDLSDIHLLGESNSANVLGKQVGGTLYIQHNTDSSNTILIKDTDQQVNVATVNFDASAVLAIKRTAEHDTKLSPRFTFVGSTFNLASGGNTLSADIATELHISGKITGGPLTKTGLGTLIIQNDSADHPNAFSNLNITGGKVIAQATGNAHVFIGTNGNSLMGEGTISLQGTTSHLEITAPANLSLGSVTFGTGAEISLRDGATFSIARTEDVAFTDGTIDFNNENSTVLVLDANTTLGSTQFLRADNATLTLKRDVTITADSLIPGTGAKFEFAPEVANPQTISQSATSNIEFKGTVVISGPGKTVLGNTITKLTALGGISLGSGTLSLTQVDQINPGTPISFVSTTSYKPGTILLNGHNQSLKFTTLANTYGIIDFGKDAQGVELTISEFGAADLRLLNWEGNALKTDDLLNPDNIWFYGYAKGAKVEGDHYVSTKDPITTSFDNALDQTSTPSDWKWNNPVNWVSDDFFNIPNAPGATANIKTNSGTLSTIKEKTLNLEANKITLGTLNTLVGDNTQRNNVALTISGDSDAKLIFDSGAANTNATWTAQAKFETDNVVIAVPVELKSNLVINNQAKHKDSRAYDKISGIVSGTATITKKGEGTLVFTANNSGWTAPGDQSGLVIEQGFIGVGEEHSLGTGPVEINRSPGATVGIHGISNDHTRVPIANKIIIKSEFKASQVKFTNETLILDDVYTIDTSPGFQNGLAGGSSIDNPSVIFASKIVDDTNSGNNGGFKFEGASHGFMGAIRFDNPNNTFSGGLEDGYVIAIVGNNQGDNNYGMVIGKTAEGKNYFGTGGIKIGDNSTLYTVVTNMDKNVEVSGVTDKYTISGNQGKIRFQGEGEATVTADARIHLHSLDARVIFSAKENTISGGEFTLRGGSNERNPRVVFEDQKDPSDTTPPSYIASTNIISGGTFNFSLENSNAYGGIDFSGKADTTNNTISGGIFNLSGNSKIRFSTPEKAPANNTNTISGGTFTLSDNSRILVGEETQSGTSSGEVVLHFTSDAKIEKPADTPVDAGIELTNNGVWSFEGGTMVNGLSLYFNAQSATGIRATNGTAIPTFNAVIKNNSGVATIENSVNTLEADKYELNGGILKVTSDNQLKSSASGTVTFNGGTLDTTNFKTELGNLVVLENGGSLILGETGKVEFASLNTWGNATNTAPAFLIQGNGDAGWTTSEGPSVLIKSIPQDFENNEARFANVAFTGFESGAMLTLVSDAGNSSYFLTPSTNAVPTSEWQGKGNATGDKNFSWSDPNNWLLGTNTNVPGSADGLKSATFRDGDSELGNKTIVVDNNYTLNHLNIETNARVFSIKPTDTANGKLIFESIPETGNSTEVPQESSAKALGDTEGDTASNTASGIPPWIKHTGISTLTITTPIELRDNTNLILTAKRDEGYVVLAGEISGAGGITKTGGGDLRITATQNTFHGFTWLDNKGHLQIRTATDSTATPLGVGDVTFGATETSITHIEANPQNTEVYLNIKGRLTLNGNFIFASASELGVLPSESAKLSSTLIINASEILLGKGEHVFQEVIKDANNREPDNIKSLHLNAPIKETSEDPASLHFFGLNHNNDHKGVHIYLAGDNTFSGGTKVEGGVYYLGNNHAFGTGQISALHSFEFHATDDKGKVLINGSGSRHITNPLIIENAEPSEVYASNGRLKLKLNGNLIWDRDENTADWKVNLPDTPSPDSNPPSLQLVIEASSENQDWKNFGTTAPEFGKSFAFTGIGALEYNLGNTRIRLFGGESDYSGGTTIDGGGDRNVFVLGADSTIKEDGAVIKGPFGTGPISLKTSAQTYFIPWSTDSQTTERTIHNKIEISNTTGTISVLKTNETENYADTVVFASKEDFFLPKNLTFDIEANATLRIDSKITGESGNGGLTKSGPGTLVLSNAQNNFPIAATVNEGALIARAESEDVLIAPINTSGRAGYFGTAVSTVTENASFDVQSNNYATGRAVLVVEALGEGKVVTIKGDPGAQPFHLSGTGAAFIVGGSGSATGEGMGFKGTGVLRLAGNGSVINGRANTGEETTGWIVADRILKDTTGDTTIGLNLRANHLELSNGTLKMENSDLLSGVVNLRFTKNGDTSGVLDLNGKSQHLRADSTLGTDAGVNGSINFPQDNTNIEFSFGRIADDNAGAINFNYWKGGNDGSGSTKVVTTGYRAGEVVPNVYLNADATTSGTGIALVTELGPQNVLIPLNKMLTWSGNAAADGTSWEQEGSGGNKSNWIDNTNPSSVAWPGKNGMAADAGQVIVFDTGSVTPTEDDKWKWDNLVIPIATDGKSSSDNAKIAIAGSILIHDIGNTTPENVQITLKSAHPETSSSSLSLDNGNTKNASITLSSNARLRVNLPVYLVSNGTDTYNNLIVNTSHPDSIVELNETITGEVGSTLFKDGSGHLFLRGANNGTFDETEAKFVGGLVGGIVLEAGHLYLGNPDSVGNLSQTARLNFHGGTLHPVEDWYKADADAPPNPDSLQYTDMTIPNYYRFRGGFTLAGDKTLTFSNSGEGVGQEGISGDLAADSTVTIQHPEGKLVLNGYNLKNEGFEDTTGDAYQATYNLTFNGPGSVSIQKSGEIAVSVNIIANASAEDLSKTDTPPLVEIAAKELKGNLTNSGYGKLKIMDYSGGTGATTVSGSITNSGPGTLEIATTNRTYAATANTPLQNTDTGTILVSGGSNVFSNGITANGTGTVRVTGKNNTFSNGITATGGGNFFIEASTTVGSKIDVSNNATLHLKAELNVSPNTSVTTTVESGGRILVDSTGKLKTYNSDSPAGSVVVNAGGKLAFEVAADGTNGTINSNSITVNYGGELWVNFSSEVNNDTLFVQGYTLSLFPNATVQDNANWSRGVGVNITQDNSSEISLASDLSWRFDHLATTGEIYIGALIPAGIFWDGVEDSQGLDVWHGASGNNERNWRSGADYDSSLADIEANNKKIAFTPGDRVVFDANLRKEDEAPLVQKVALDNSDIDANDTITVHSMLVTGNKSEFTFHGNKLVVDGNFAPANDEYAGISSDITVSNGAKATFKNEVTSPSLKIENNATVTLVYEDNDPNDKFTFGDETSVGIEILAPTGTLVFEEKRATNSPDNTFSGDISGRGSLEKTGGGTLTLTGKLTYNGDSSATRVKEGTLIIAPTETNNAYGLGTIKTGDDNNPTGSKDYSGTIEIEESATLELKLSGEQKFSGRIGHDYNDTPVGNGYTYPAKAKDGTITFATGSYEIASQHNTFQGTLNIGTSDASSVTVKVSGGIGTVKETFDGDKPWKADYYHNRYTGNINIYANSFLEFSYKGDYQQVAGTLSGGGNLKVNSGMPFYFTGDASGFKGATTISGNSAFHLNSAFDYGSADNRTESFKVETDSALYIGGDGKKIYTKIFEMEANTTLVVNAKEFEINANSVTFSKDTDKNVTFVFRISQEDMGNQAAKLAFETGENGDSGKKGAVIYSGQNLRLDVGYISLPSETTEVILMSGLNTKAMLGEIEWLTGDDLFCQERKLANSIFSDADQVMMANFKVRFTIGGELRIDLANAPSHIPEPGTYGLFSGIFIAGLALLHRRRKNKN